jgi:hypothetical protein
VRLGSTVHALRFGSYLFEIALGTLLTASKKDEDTVMLQIF